MTTSKSENGGNWIRISTITKQKVFENKSDKRLYYIVNDNTDDINDLSTVPTINDAHTLESHNNTLSERKETIPKNYELWIKAPFSIVYTEM